MTIKRSCSLPSETPRSRIRASTTYLPLAPFPPSFSSLSCLTVRLRCSLKGGSGAPSEPSIPMGPFLRPPWSPWPSRSVAGGKPRAWCAPSWGPLKATCRPRRRSHRKFSPRFPPSKIPRAWWIRLRASSALSLRTNRPFSRPWSWNPAWSASWASSRGKWTSSSSKSAFAGALRSRWRRASASTI